MNADIEHTLQELIDQHGIEKIYDALTPLIGKLRWSEWQHVYNLLNRLNQRKQAKPAERRRGFSRNCSAGSERNA